MKGFYLVILLLMFPYSKAEQNSDNVQFSGFGTFGLISSGSDNYGYRTDISQSEGSFEDQLEYTVLIGVQFDYSISSNFDAVTQFVYREQNKQSFDNAVSLAFIRYSPLPEWSFRFGRTAFDLFLLTEYRDVGIAYKWAHAPSEVYGLIPYRKIDGMDVTYSSKVSDLDFRAKLFTGKSKADIGIYESTEPFEIENILGLALSIGSLEWSIQARYTVAKLTDDPQSSKDINNGLLYISQVVPNFEYIWPDAASFVNGQMLKGATADYFSLGGYYDFSNWSFIAELSLTDSSTTVIRKLIGAYATISYNTGDNSFYSTYSFTDSDPFDMSSLGINLEALSLIPGGVEIYYGLGVNKNFYSSNQSTVSLGWRWDYSESIALKVQWDQTDIKHDGAALWLNKEIFNRPADKINSLFINMSFTF